ncbi:hypothetical protein WN66_06427 [Saccharomyces cerevisiae]|uniref:Putative uncharacterized protein YPL114W n=2 Tax=Saccharomyces cerevisiae TaxID=4932 RepID=YPL14_YEAST|nr:RecName: Full=Putative uncharacterized protein YPL114W [Saccharomyces cerevisiae S288C]AAB68253.1 Ypl114wp [Saccharomyces cerevisiae]KZV07403.1 hypothetical protein WN66_06427 [Saccharomyces cerevisiae]CAY86847.1 EC1118_1P2_1838p [Saccharomyces cerevisiae EC1118]
MVQLSTYLPSPPSTNMSCTFSSVMSVCFMTMSATVLPICGKAVTSHLRSNSCLTRVSSFLNTSRPQLATFPDSRASSSTSSSMHVPLPTLTILTPSLHQAKLLRLIILFVEAVLGKAKMIKSAFFQVFGSSRSEWYLAL